MTIIDALHDQVKVLQEAVEKYKADAERLAKVVNKISNWQIQKYAGAWSECLFCGNRGPEHRPSCISLKARAALAAHERY